MLEWNGYIMSNVAGQQCRSTCTYALFTFSLPQWSAIFSSSYKHKMYTENKDIDEMYAYVVPWTFGFRVIKLSWFYFSDFNILKYGKIKIIMFHTPINPEIHRPHKELTITKSATSER